MRKLFESAGFFLNEKQEEDFKKYYELLIEWNKRINLTSVTEWEQVKKKHFLDSVMPAKYISFEEGDNKRCIDVGTGAGFPGLPLAILFPKLEMVLLDSLNKRIDFLNTVIGELQLNNVRAVHGRAEDTGKDPAYREKFDFVVSRAVANISTLSEYCIPFLKIKGKFLSYKSVKGKEEIKEFSNVFSLLGCRLSDNYEFNLPGSDINRNILVIIKESVTDSKYPRRAGKPARKPLR